MKNPKILVVYGYHPKETFATAVGKRLEQSVSDPRIIVARYKGRGDSKTSTYRLRKFIGEFSPDISVILHSTEKFATAMIYCTPSKCELRKVPKHLIKFILEQSDKKACPLAYGGFLTPNTDRSFIDIELNPAIGVLNAENLVTDFLRYLLNLFSQDKLKL